MSIYQIIRAEIDGNAALYGSMTDQQVADELNTVNKQTIVPTKITTLQILDILGASSGAAFLVALENLSATNDAVRLATRSIDTVGVDVGNTVTRTMMDNLAAAGVLDQVSVQTVKDKAAITRSRAQEIGLPVVRAGYVTEARK